LHGNKLGIDRGGKIPITRHIERGNAHCRSGLAAIIATHNMDLAERMDRRARPRDGKVVELG
jgi:ABC-type lipoprotein export system ATPase subunit